MSSSESLQVLPAWVWFSFVIVTVGVIALIYSRGNWRPTVASMALTLLGLLLANESIHFDAYLDTHFIGSYDRLGIPFIQANPGWPLLLAAWPLWLIPVVLAILLTLAICILWNKCLPPNTTVLTTENFLLTDEDISKKLINTELNHQLKVAINTINQQAAENQNLEFKISRLEKQQQQSAAHLQDKILALHLQIEAKENQTQQLIHEQIAQTETIIQLNNQLNKLQNKL